MSFTQHGWGNRKHRPSTDTIVECQKRPPFNGCGRRRSIPVDLVSRTNAWPVCCDGQVMEIVDDDIAATTEPADPGETDDSTQEVTPWR